VKNFLYTLTIQYYKKNINNHSNFYILLRLRQILQQLCKTIILYDSKFSKYLQKKKL